MKNIGTCSICENSFSEGSHDHLCVCEHQYASHEANYRLAGMKCAHENCPCKHFTWSREDKPRKPTAILRLVEQLELAAKEGTILKEVMSQLSPRTRSRMLSHLTAEQRGEVIK